MDEDKGHPETGARRWTDLGHPEDRIWVPGYRRVQSQWPEFAMENERRSVLVVEDDVDLREVIALALRRAGFRVATAAEGKAALDQVSNEMPGVIVLDMTMPVMDGHEFTRRFREKYGDETPIVVLTAAEDARRGAGQIDARHHLDKPFSVRELVEIVERFVER